MLVSLMMNLKMFSPTPTPTKGRITTVTKEDGGTGEKKQQEEALRKRILKEDEEILYIIEHVMKSLN